MNTDTRSVVIAEDNTLLRDGLVGLFERFGYTVTGAFDSTDGLIEHVRVTQPALVLVDVRMPPTFTDEGLQAALRIRAMQPNQPVFVLSQYIHREHAKTLLANGNGGIGYLLKDRVADTRTLIAAMDLVRNGGTTIDQTVMAELLDHPTGQLTRLTNRELETLSHMARGLSNSAIADAMSVSEATIAKNIRYIFEKLDLEQTEETHRRVLAVLTYVQKSQ